MGDLGAIVNTITRAAFILMSATLFAWILLPDYRANCLGFLIGISIGLVNIRYLAVKVRQLSDYVATNEKKRLSLGFVTRLCFTLIAIMVAVRFEQVALVWTVIGLFFLPVLLIPVSIIHSIKKA